MIKLPIPFRGFDELGDVRIYRNGILPHWRQDGCTYFVTFRLADSIPRNVVAEMEHDRRMWLSSRRINPESPNWKDAFAKLSTVERRSYEQLIGRLLNKSLDDCHGACNLRDKVVAEQVESAMRYFDGTRILLGDCVVMPNHVHVLITPINGIELEDVLHSVKSFTATQINRYLNQSGRFWHRDSYDHIVRDFEQLCAYQEYISVNPRKAYLEDDEYIHTRATYSYS